MTVNLELTTNHSLGKTMGAFFKAELKDRFLEYAAERNDYFQIHLLYDEFLRPNYSLEYVYQILQEILDYEPDLIDVMSGNGSKYFMISATSTTDDFLEMGGFKHLFLQEEEKWDSLMDTFTNRKPVWKTESDNQNSQEKILGLKRERLIIYALLAALLFSFAYSLFDFVFRYANKDEKITQSMFYKEVQILKNENELLRQELRALQARTQELEGNN